MDLRPAVTSLAALASGGLAAFVLTNPRTHAWAIAASEREIERWVDSQPIGVAAGVVAVPVVVGLLQQAGSRRLAWILAAVAAAILCGATYAVPHVAGVDALIAVHFVKTLAAGVLLGAAVAALWGTPSRLVLALGVLTGFATASSGRFAPSPESAGLLQMTTSAAGEPPWWLLIAAVVTCLAAVAAAPAGLRIERSTTGVIVTAVIVAFAAAVGHRALTWWIDRNALASDVTLWIAVLVSLALVCAGALLAAARLGVGEGRLILASTGVAAVAALLFQDLRHPLAEVPRGAVLTVTGLSVAAGLAIAGRWRRPEWGLLLIALIPLAAAIWPEFGTGGPLLLVRLAVFGVGAGLAVGAALPTAPVAAAVGLGLPFVSFVFPTVASATRTMAGPETILGISWEDGETIPRFESSWGTHMCAVALLLVVLFCAYYVTRRGVDGRERRSVDETQGPQTPEDQ
ncbi:hypothetical protein G4H71_14785 [Rhodococcus triatomae]|uniref:Uncharacterized protein n=1 Tax=Rhodococcus triatomae TaxID=300028 RepID=A0A1G8NDB2_9NOCA|nr:hypothetical protein [Rhodococcus triatomae]QNG19958.1 hypothetical protein G4H72_15590 [Rhodococcus triatomae]QNG24127.1 hypothetical protein G4H71_14785 [Rhodococcus triatomae]SDI77510.1 hypothetical protein SAMN05444695_11115 [Rhodococcus triatomae]